MIRKILSDTRFHIASIILCAAMISSFLGLSANLTDVTEPLESSFEMKMGADFGINIATDSFKSGSLITPGSSIDYDPYITNNGDYEAYVFMEITVPDETFRIGMLSSKWSLLSITDYTSVYYYGTNDRLTPLSKKTISRNTNTSVTQPICDSLTLDKDTPLYDDTYTVTATGYAIQTTGLADKDPKSVWDMIMNPSSDS